ncbi:MAG: response regulator [Kiritimatiellia bacterium]
MAKENILIIEDEIEIRELLRYNLRKAGYTTLEAGSGEEGLRIARAERPAVILLDIMLPGMDGMDACRAIKADANLQKIPVIMLTAKGEEADVVSGLEVGADDYITKPFSPRVVMARVKAVLRRGSTAGPAGGDAAEVRHGAIHMDPARHSCLAGGRPLDLTATEYKLLYFLCRRPGRVFTRQQIVDACRGEDYAVTERSVDVQVVGLRKKLADHADMVETVRGVGYRAKELE